MAGKKGRSGRYSKSVGLQLEALANRSVKWANDNWNDLSAEHKVRIITSIGAKYIPNEHNHTGSFVIEKVLFSD